MQININAQLEDAKQGSLYLVLKTSAIFVPEAVMSVLACQSDHAQAVEKISRRQYSQGHATAIAQISSIQFFPRLNANCLPAQIDVPIVRLQTPALLVNPSLSL